MRTLYLMAIIIITGAMSFSDNKIFAQDNQSKSIPLEAFAADKRFSIENVTFYKRLDKASMSLNINFEVHNRTIEDLKLKVFVVAYKRANRVDSETRKWIPYPKWRKRDLDREIISYIYLDSIPKVDKNAVDSSIKEPDLYPAFQQYLRYLNENPGVGADLLVKGLNSSSVQNGDFPNINILAQPMKTTVFGKLKVPFNPDNEFFDHFGIIITDPEQKKIVGSQLFHFETPFKTF